VTGPRLAGGGARLGEACVDVDGVLVATVNAHSKATLHRGIVFARGWSAVGTHTLRIVVVGTAGPARVDLDALEMVRYPPQPRVRLASRASRGRRAARQPPRPS
jgi:hypothetical protein